MSGDTVTAGVSQQLSRTWRFTSTASYTNLRDFARTWNINAPNTGIDRAPSMRDGGADCGVQRGAAQRAASAGELGEHHATEVHGLE